MTKFEAKCRIYKALNMIAQTAPELNEAAAAAAEGYTRESKTIEDLRDIAARLREVIEGGK